MKASTFFVTQGHCERCHLNILMIWMKETLQEIKQWKLVRLGNTCKQTNPFRRVIWLEYCSAYDEILKHCSATGIWTLSGNDI